MKLFGNSRNSAPKKKSGKRRLKKALLITLAALLTIAAGLFAMYKLYVKPPEIPVQPVLPVPSGGEAPEDGAEPAVSLGNRKEGVYTFLFAGADEADYNADVIMVASFDTVNHKLDMLSIPRDTMINVSRSNKKINASYGVGKDSAADVEGGMENLRDAVSTIVGFKPDFFVKVDFEGFKQVIDAIGGVEFDVPYAISKRDPYINIQKGRQVLNGEQALGLVRYRGYATADLGRIGMSQEFLKALAAKMFRGSNLTKIPAFIDIMNKYMKSDINTGNLLWLGKELLSVDTENDLGMHMIPVDVVNASYVCAREQEVLDLVNDTVNPYIKPITSSSVDIIHTGGGSGQGSGSNAAVPGSSSSGKPENTKEPPPSPDISAPPSAEPSPSPSGQPGESPLPSPSGQPGESPSPSPGISAPPSAEPSLSPGTSAPPSAEPSPSPPPSAPPVIIDTPL